MSYDGTNATMFQVTPPPSLPINHIRFPLSPSPILAWALGSSAPIYTTVSPQPHLLQGSTTYAIMCQGGLPALGVLYGGVDGPLFHGGNLLSTHFAASPSLDGTGTAPFAIAAQILQAGVCYL